MVQRPRGGGPRRDDDDDRDEYEHEGHPEREHKRVMRDDVRAHHATEKLRFAGGHSPTLERYALARDQWYRLPGAVVRPSMDPGAGAPTPEPQSPEQTLPNEKGAEA